MKPSIGRIVHYNQSGTRTPAIILHVYSDECVKLRVLGDADNDIRDSVSLEKESEVSASLPNEMSTEPGTFSWPPFVPQVMSDRGSTDINKLAGLANEIAKVGTTPSTFVQRDTVIGIDPGAKEGSTSVIATMPAPTEVK